MSIRIMTHCIVFGLLSFLVNDVYAGSYRTIYKPCSAAETTCPILEFDDLEDAISCVVGGLIDSQSISSISRNSGEFGCHSEGWSGECSNALIMLESGRGMGIKCEVQEFFCPGPYIFNSDAFMCEVYCSENDSFSIAKKSCITPPQERSCKEQTGEPIDLTQGRKYRSEFIISAGKRFPFSVSYFYNNQSNHEKTANGVAVGNASVISADREPDHTIPPIPASEYKNIYTSQGLPKNDPAVLPTQHYGTTTQYWRHNFDEVLQIQNGAFTYEPPKGNSVAFTSLGVNATYPYLNLQALSAGEESYAGYKLTNTKNGAVKKFDANGRLMKIERSSTDVLTLAYSESNLHRVTNSEGSYLEFTYEVKQTNSIYSVEASTQNYPTQITSNTGEKVQLKWDQTYAGQTASFPMLTQISEAFTGATPNSARSFEYNDDRYPASISDMYTISNLATGTKAQYAQFTYDDKGRATTSGLTNGYEGVTVTYPSDTQTIVTNALGKNTIYNYADFNGVKRLQSVVGEATDNCAKSNTVYDYYDNGNLKTTTQNGVVTHYQYNEKNQKTVTTKAQGLEKEFVSQTCWNAEHDKPERVIEPGRVLDYEYFDNGLIKNSSAMTRSLDNQACE